MTTVEARSAGAVGTSPRRREDPRLLTGRGHYLADHDTADLCHIAILRSTAAHARLASLEVAEAARLPGVLAVVTAGDLVAAGARPLDHLLGPPAKPLRWGVLADERVRFVGEPIAAVVATSRAVAEDALELIEVDYDDLPPVVGAEAALQPGAALLYPEWGTNEFFHLEDATPGLDAALAAAPHRFTERFESHRVVGLPLEGQGAQGSWDPGTGRLTLLSSSQQPHQLRTVVAEVCGLPETAVRVISPDIGGGFGNKQHFSREECLVGLLARMTGRTVRWSQDRTESLTASVHSRAQVHHVEAGYDDDGRVLALRVRVLSDLGNPVLYFSGIGPALVTVSTLSGGYAIPEIGWKLSCVATSTCPVGAYRGFGQPEAHFTTERVMDLVASSLRLDPLVVRRRNLLPDRPRPWRGRFGQRLDVGSLGPQVDELERVGSYAEWRARQASARADGRWVGLGVSTLVQGTAPNQHSTAGRFGSIEMASISVLPDGRAEVRVGTKSQGQAHETSLAQIAADALGLPLEWVTVADGDTDALPYGQGTWGSRTMVMAGGAVLKAAGRVRAQMAAIGSSLGLDVPALGPLSPEVAREIARVAWWEQDRLPPGADPGLSAVAVHDAGFTGDQPGGGHNHDDTYTTAMTLVAVEVDPATGQVRILDACCVLDCGVVVNPTVVAGQLQGGFAQGVGVALLEEVRYSPEGQPLCSTLLDYTIPTAGDVPVVRVALRPTPSDVLGGFRGMGETGIIAAPAAIVGAVEDALSPLGVRLRSTRAHAADLRALVRAAGWVPDPATWSPL
ncbi:MAG TPA: xanthine dehydrogenase family protein molybdopterin-binding subunit [Acidimicrobiales bacterium]|nr:xanthine dehydrogenase family protein molybdopterin-binding subunit [Acidimicrobiales bacterium]